jgi:hypothetical protein
MVQAGVDTARPGVVEDLLQTPIPCPAIDGGETAWRIAGWPSLALLGAAMLGRPQGSVQPMLSS